MKRKKIFVLNFISKSAQVACLECTERHGWRQVMYRIHIFSEGGDTVYTVQCTSIVLMWVGFNFSMDFLQVILGRIWFGFYVVFARPEINCDVKNLNFLGQFKFFFATFLQQSFSYYSNNQNIFRLLIQKHKRTFVTKLTFKNCLKLFAFFHLLYV